MAEANRSCVEPSMSPYHYTTLSSPTTQFRLATIEPSVDHHSPIRCSLSVHAIGVSPAYIAISYVCGDPHDSKDIFIDNATLAVYATLDNAIRHMRKADTPLVLWADALCIHQTNVHEKSMQVGMMSKVYGNAERVCGWLGPANESFMFALRALERLESGSVQSRVNQMFYLMFVGDGNYRFMQHLPFRVKQYFKTRSLAAGIAKDVKDYSPTSSASAFLRTIVRASPRGPQGVRPGSLSWAAVLGKSVSSTIETFLLENTFFRRTWIYQELTLAERLIFHCGHHSFDGHKVINGIGFYTSSVSDDSVDQAGDLWALANSALTILRVRSSLHDSNHGTPHTLLQLINYFSGASCADTRDKVFALLAMTSDPLVTKNPADYSLSPAEVAIRLTLTHVDETHSLDILRYCGGSNSPSWAMNLDAFTDESPVKGSFQDLKYRTASALHAKVVLDSTNLDLETFQLAGIQVDTIYGTACLCTTWPRNRKCDPLNEWWELAKSVGYDELDFWMALLAEAQEAVDGTIDFQSRREEVRLWLKRKDSRWPGEEFFMNIQYNEGYRLFVTDSGSLGFCGDYAQKGDLVCVLFGGDTPYILRPTATSAGRSQYTLIEPCYVHGIMEGELVEGIKAGEYEEKVFALV